MTTDYRALCAELADALDSSNGFLNSDGEWVVPEPIGALVARARTALSQPEPEEPTDEELNDTYWKAWHEHLDRTNSVLHAASLRAVLARWGSPAITPIPVSERLPGPEDCDAEGRLYAVYNGRWFQIDLSCIVEGGFTHWLPAHALPLPAAPGEGQ